jgi:hypothetical protein
MQDAQERFWMVEPPTVMILAPVLVHVGVITAKRPPAQSLIARRRGTSCWLS